MAEDIKKEEVVEEEVVETDESAKDSESSSTEEVDWKAVADAEKARADAAEKLIVKNKSISKRQEKKEDEEKPESGLTEERVLELINASKGDADDPDVKALAEAQRRVKELEGKNSEITRTIKKKDTTRTETTVEKRDAEKGTAPKLPENSPLKGFEHKGNGIYAKKLPNGQQHFVNRNAGPGQKRAWVA